jgi:Cu-Zn family superoxide dismutase
MMRRVAVLQVLLAGWFAAGSGSQQLPMAMARLVNRQGQDVGLVKMHEMPGRGVMLKVEVSGLSQGSHAIQIYPVGRCDAAAFEAAGAGSHGAELGTLVVPSPGRIELERVARRFTLADGAPNSLIDADGTAILIFTDGSPVVCGVIQR